ncbi:MAG TPA: anthranilate phosphoribosyltransferase, partial [Chromatiales bacterium]|nr:anthranilate phosphoribosyltransferase [Chromatiales bacterium]
MFAPQHHGAMKHAIGPRREMGVRTLFNLLGPLTNPAGAPHQVIGVFSAQWVAPLAEVLGKLGSKHVMIVHADDGMDEISIGSATAVAELKDGRVTTYKIAPEDFGMTTADCAALAVKDANESLQLIRSLLSGERGAAYDIVALNAGAAIYVAGLTDSHAAGVKKAQRVMSDGSANEKLDQFIAYSNAL